MKKKKQKPADEDYKIDYTEYTKATEDIFMAFLWIALGIFIGAVATKILMMNGSVC